MLRGGARDENTQDVALAAGAAVRFAVGGARVVRGEEGSELSAEACGALGLPRGSRWGEARLPAVAAGDASKVSHDFTPFSELEDDEEIVRDLFSAIDSDNDGAVSRSELSAAIQRHRDDREMVAALENLLPQAPESGGGAGMIGFESFRHALEQLPRIRGERTRWARSLGLEGALSRLLKKGDIFDGLSGLRGLEGEALESHVTEVSKAFSEMLPTILRSGLRRLNASAKESPAKSAVQAHINSKFVLDGAFVGHYATLDDFYRGPEALIGAPNPRVLEGAEKEHCLRANAKTAFRTSNYGLVTCPALEWEFVVCPKVPSLRPPPLRRTDRPVRRGPPIPGRRGLSAHAAAEIHVESRPRLGGRVWKGRDPPGRPPRAGGGGRNGPRGRAAPRGGGLPPPLHRSSPLDGEWTPADSSRGAAPARCPPPARRPAHPRIRTVCGRLRTCARCASPWHRLARSRRLGDVPNEPFLVSPPPACRLNAYGLFTK